MAEVKPAESISNLKTINYQDFEAIRFTRRSWKSVLTVGDGIATCLRIVKCTIRRISRIRWAAWKELFLT